LKNERHVILTYLLLLASLFLSACDTTLFSERRPLHGVPVLGPVARGSRPVPADPATGATLERLVVGLRRPAYLTHAGDERLFVVEQWGQIRIIENGQLLEEPFLDVSDRISTDGSERGLLGLAFHPRHPRDPRFFVIYTNPDGNTELASYRVDPRDPNRADPDSASLLFLAEQPFGNHNGGQLLFGPDGYLYVGMGDGGGVSDFYGNAQDPGTLLGAILRIDVDDTAGNRPYAIPPDNPFVGQEGARGELWAIGLRNPWSFSFDPLTGDLYITDVGQEGPEEVNFWEANDSAGINYGWPIREGSRCYEADGCRLKGLRMPVTTYEHIGGHCAIVGGALYRGPRFPDWHGNYFFSDFCSGTVWSLAFTDAGLWQRTTVHQAQAPVSGIGAGADGELYALFYREGAVYRILQP